MADNTELNAGSGGDTIASDDIAGIKHQRVKIQYGADGSATDVSDAAPLPIDDAGGSLTVDNAGTFATQVDGDALTALQLIDDVVATDDTTTHATGTTKGVNIMAAATPTDGSVAANDIGSVAMSTDRRLHVDAQIVGVDAALTVDGSGVTQPVSGTVTANLSATDNAVLDNIDTDTTTIASDTTEIAANYVADGSALGKGVLIQGDDGIDRKNINVDATTGDVQVDVTNTVTVDGSGVTQPVSGTITANLSATDNAVLDNIQAAVETIDNPVLAEDAPFSGGSVNMAGAIRDDSLTTLTPIEGDAVPLRVNSTGALHVTGGGGGTEYNVDDAAPTVVTMAGAVRDDSLTTLTEADGDATLLRVSSTGALHVTGGGGGTEYTEDVATANPIVGTATLMERDDALSTLTPIEGDWAGLRCSAEGALWTQDFNSDTIAGDTTSIDGKITACDTGAVVISSGTVTANLGATDNAVLDDIAAQTSAASVATEGAALASGVLIQGDDGTDRKNINVDATTGDVQVDVTNTVTVDGSGVTQPVSGTVTANLSATDNAVLDNIQTAVEVIDNAISGTEMQVDVVAALPAGTNAIGKLAANSGVDIGDVDVTSISAGSNLIGDVGISGARTSGGTTLYKNIDVDESEDQVKGTAGQLYWIHAINLSSATKFLKIYNATAASVTVGTTVPDLTFPLPTQGDTNGAGFTLSIPNGIAFGTAITIAATTGVADNDSGAPGANEVVVNLGYA